MRSLLCGLLCAAWALAPAAAAEPAATAGTGGALRLTVVFNNVEQRPGLTPGWGFACLVEGLERTLLFDTGADGGVLLGNLRRLGLRPQAVDAVVLSHAHADHTGGLDALLGAAPGAEVWLPEGFPAAFLRALAGRGTRVRPVAAAGRLFDHAYSTGPLDHGLVEQALVIDAGPGLVVITGCAHPGVVRVAEAATRLTRRPVHLLVGGFHLLRADRAEIDAVVERLRALGVAKVAPSHCTGAAAIARFRQAWGLDFVEGGLGAVIEVPCGEAGDPRCRVAACARAVLPGRGGRPRGRHRPRPDAGRCSAWVG